MVFRVQGVWPDLVRIFPFWLIMFRFYDGLRECAKAVVCVCLLVIDVCFCRFKGVNLLQTLIPELDTYSISLFLFDL